MKDKPTHDEEERKMYTQEEVLRFMAMDDAGKDVAALAIKLARDDVPLQDMFFRMRELDIPHEVALPLAIVASNLGTDQPFNLGSQFEAPAWLRKAGPENAANGYLADIRRWVAATKPEEAPTDYPTTAEIIAITNATADLVYMAHKRMTLPEMMRDTLLSGLPLMTAIAMADVAYTVSRNIYRYNPAEYYDPLPF